MLGSTRIDSLIPAPKRHRGPGMRYSIPLPSYLPLGGRDESINPPIKQRGQIYADSRSTPPSQYNPTVSLALSPTPSSSPVPNEHTPFPVNYKPPGARKKQYCTDHSVTVWPARPGAADYFDTAQFTFTQTPYNSQKGPVPPRMCIPLEAATDHPCNSEIVATTIAPDFAAVDSPSLPPTPILHIPACRPNNTNSHPRAVGLIPHHHHQYYFIPSLPSSSASIRSTEHPDANPIPEVSTGAAYPSANHNNPTINRSRRAHQKASKQKRRQRRSRAVPIPTVCHPTP